MRSLPLPLARAVDTALDRTVAPGYTRLGLGVRRLLPTWPADPAPDALAETVAIVTGATSGLGAATAEGLARLGATVRMVVRDEEKAAGVRDQIVSRVPGARLVIDRCDLADLDDVRRLARRLVAEPGDQHVGVLVHNAGALPAQRTESPQGHELTMAVHVLTPVLLTELLRPRLRGARVTVVTSGGMYAQRLRADDPDYHDGRYSGTTAYARSKRAQVELLPVLAARWAADRVEVNATHPGWADTPGVTSSLPTFHRVTGPLLRDAVAGADTTVWLSATEDDPGSGRLWHDRRVRPTSVLPSTRTTDLDRRRMWAWVRDQLGITGS